MLQFFDKFIQAQLAKDSINDFFGLCILVEKFSEPVTLSCIHNNPVKNSIMT